MNRCLFQPPSQKIKKLFNVRESIDYRYSRHGCIVLSNICPSAENLLFFSKTFPRSTLDSWGPTLFVVRSFTSWYALLRLFLVRKVSVSAHWVPIHSSFAFFTALWVLLFVFLYYFAPSYSYCFFFKFLQISPLVAEVENISGPQGFIMWRSFPSISLAATVAAVLWVVKKIEKRLFSVRQGSY